MRQLLKWGAFEVRVFRHLLGDASPSDPQPPSPELGVWLHEEVIRVVFWPEFVQPVVLGLAFPASVLTRQSKKRHHVRTAQNAPRLYHPEIDTILPREVSVRSNRDL
jgi:hypothetical protein